MYKHRQTIKSLYADNKLDERDITYIDELKDVLGKDYSKGRINDKQYENMNNEISMLYQEIYKKKIDSLNSTSDKDSKKELNKIINSFLE